jgi:cytidylate kinase
MTTITVSRQMGSYGYEASQRAADILGYRLVYRELINIAARRAGAPEMALAAIDELGLLNLCPDPAVCQAYRDAVHQVMHEIAGFGNAIIIGRSGQVILKDTPGVIHVRIIAPFQVRADRIASRHQISVECARSRIEASDHYRQRYLQRFYQVRCNDPELYDLTINTARISPAETAALLVNCVREHQLETIHSHADNRENLPTHHLSAA